MNRQKLLLFCLLILLALAIVWSYARLPRQEKIETLTYLPGLQAPPPLPDVETRESLKGLELLRLDLLDRAPSEFKGYRRNLFAAPAMEPAKKGSLQRRLPIPPPPPPPPAEMAPRRELARFTFLGFLKKGNNKTVFLSKDGGEIILVKEGDLFAQRYQAASITDRMLTIRVSDTGEEIVVPLMESAASY